MTASRSTEETPYGGLDEAGTDRICRHLLAGDSVADLADRPTGAEQALRQ
jgi:hypothetical protein